MFDRFRHISLTLRFPKERDSLYLNDDHVANRFTSRWKVVIHVVARVLAREHHVLIAETPPLRQRAVAVGRQRFVHVVKDATFRQHLFTHVQGFDWNVKGSRDMTTCQTKTEFVGSLLKNGTPLAIHKISLYTISSLQKKPSSCVA